MSNSIQAARDAVRARFDAEKRVLSFAEYLELAEQHPRRFCRDAPRYMRDAFDFYGSYAPPRSWGAQRYRLFDLPFETAEGRRSDRLAGQEELQHAVYRALEAFEREGHVHRLLLLHGPNGSAKSTFANCLAAGLENYSHQDEGALYRFSWVFPRGEGGKGIGFSTGDAGPAPGDSYAHLPEERIDAKMPSELREHPLLLLPTEERRQLLSDWGVESPPDLLWSGDLGHKNRQVYDALLTAYRGDLARVLAHVQVERFYISRRYRVGAVTIGPQMAVDARERQITADRSLGSLPASLSATTLFETFGELVDGACGLVEFSDLLKRPLDAWKYLLSAIETGEVPLPFSNMELNAVLLASSNEMHLKAFQEHPEYHSFRGRLQLIRVPYLRDYKQEQVIYDAQIVPQLRVHVAPHATYVAALWAVLTRLRRSEKERFDDPDLGALAASLTPLEKADLYAEARVPRRFDSDEANTLRAEAAAIYNERSGTMDYEGLYGASPREMRGILHAAADETSLSPRRILAELSAFCERDDYIFLRIEPDGDYHDAARAVTTVRERWLDLADDELCAATGLIDESQYLTLFDRYISHVSHLMKDESIMNPVTGHAEDPDQGLIDRVEGMLGADEPAAFRHEILSHIATWALDHPGEKVDYAALFPQYIDQLEEAYYEQQKTRIARVARDVLRLATGDEDDIEDRPAAEAALRVLCDEYGYEPISVQEAVGALLESRYA